MSIFQNYIKELQKHKISEITEHSHRTALQNLLNSYIEEIQQKTNILHEPKRQGKNGSPDFMITANESIIGYIENKKILQDLNEIIYSEQIEKYKKLSNNLLITNYVEFVWIRDNEITRVMLCDVTDIENKNFKSKPDNETQVKELLKKFFTQAPQGISDIEKLAFCLAERAKYLFAILFDELKEQELDESKQDTIWLAYTDFINNVYEELTIEGFADTFAQTLTYGLFLAKLNCKTEEPINLRNVDKHISKSFTLIKNIVRFLQYIENDKYNKAQWIIEEILSIINNIDLKTINESLSFSKRKKSSNEEYKDPYIYFYENFLSEYNPKLRKGRGVYYTPISVVRFIINSVNSILKDKSLFNIKDGIADYNKVNILDFATGTGTFLLEILEQINAVKPFNKPEGNMLVQNHVLKNLYGFEFLIAPYVISHVKLSQFLKENGYELKEEERLQIYLTNTLEDKEPQKSLFLTSLAGESQLAQNIKRNKKILVITGNPPYSGHSSNASEVHFKVSKTLKSGETIFVNKKKDTWIGNLVKDYFTIEGIKIKERNPKQLQDDYVKFIRFAQYKIEQTGQGIVAIVTNHGFMDNPTFRAMRYNLLKTFDQIQIIDLHGNARKRESTPEGTKDENVFDIQQGVCISLLIKNKGIPKKVLRSDFFGLRDTKNKLLNETEFSKIEWTELNPSAPFYLFAHQNEKVIDVYNYGISLNNIFEKYCVGVVSGNDSLYVSTQKADLIKKLENKNLTFNQTDIKEIIRRPFDKQYILYNKHYISRDRSEVMKHLDNENIALNSSKSIMRQAGFTDVLISNCLSDKHYFSGNNYVFPLYIFQQIINENNEHETISTVNFKDSFKEYIEKKYKRKYTPEQILSYIYAVLHSPTYREKYADILKVDFPKIPFCENEKDFEYLAKTGEDLYKLHLEPTNVEETITVIYDGEIEKDVVETVKYQEIENKKRIYINKTNFFENIPESVFEFQIGGYKVLDKYLKERKGKELSIQEKDYFKSIVNVLNYTINTMSKIDKIAKIWI